MNGTRRLLAFGDSLTWGWVPVEPLVPTSRYPFRERWTGALAEALGEGYEIVEEGLSGRTTTADDPTDPRLNGAAYLPSALATHLPLDLVMILLGTNDTKAYFNRSAFDIAVGASTLLVSVLQSAGGVGTAYPAPPTLLIAPPPLGGINDPWFAEMWRGGAEKSRELGRLCRAVADTYGAGFLDAGEVITTDGVDGVHFTADANRALGQAVAGKVREMLDAEAPRQGTIG
jgi:lysophospholipase L1-like esterase